jgi:ABC-type nitrate/sulfonate/bicarbonate transport system substrate-binding protein
VYLNEEPFKLSERIGEPIVVFDPADDGVVLYGNVLVTTTDVLATRQKDLATFLHNLASAWEWVRSYPDSAVTIIRPLYPDVSDSVLAAQIRQTAAFVFFQTSQAGVIDTRQGGRLQATIDALKTAGSLTRGLTLEVVAPLVISPSGATK